MKQREKVIEKYLKEQVEKNNGIIRKWVSPNHRGVPDRICIFATGLIAFVECKAKEGKLSKLQEIELANLMAYNCPVAIVSSKKDVDAFITWALRLVEKRRANLTTKKGDGGKLG